MTSLTDVDVAVRYRVGDLVFDSGAARVLRDGVELPIPKLSFDVLRVLIEAAPNLVSLETLMNRAWPGLVVSPETVVQRIKLLRDALGDDAREPRYIAGVRGRGYRMVAAVEQLTAREPPEQSSAAPGEPVAPVTAPTVAAPPARRRFARIGAIALLLALAVIATFVAADRWLHPASRPAAHVAPPPPRSVAVLPFSSLTNTPNDGVLALGIAEAVLHQLAAAPDLIVIARTSSFSFKDRGVDAREVGRMLNVRYLLEGSVQSDGAQLRVTAQLIDTQTGANVWSVRFERSPRDIFKVQDDISLAVARTLKLSLEGGAAERLSGQGTANFDAYFSFLQGRAEMASLRLADVSAAATLFTHAIELDPDFAPAYVELADAKLMVAEFEVTGDRRVRVARAIEEGTRLVERALALGGANGHAYVMRGYLRAFSDLAAAEADYRRGLELSPNYAKGYEGLASVIFETPTRRDEALVLLDRARALDPLEPRYDVLKAVFLQLGRGALPEADAILVDVLGRHPLYEPALTRLAVLRGSDEGRFSEGIKFGEQALALDPRSEWTRRALISEYAAMGDLVAARRLAADPQHPESPRELPILEFLHDWRRAGEIAYQSEADGTQLPLDSPVAIHAIREHARATGDYRRARALLERLSGVTWDAAGNPQVPVELGLANATVGLGDILIQTGERERGRRVLEASLRDMDYVEHVLKRGGHWYENDRPIAYALLGDTEAALSALERAAASGYACIDFAATATDPAFAALRETPRFKALVSKMAAHARDEYAAVEKLRGEHLVPAADAPR